ncbi:unnamed protein product [Ilex paraguariensis]|uniref:Auxin-responsive protein n=1 Tax=Ilex paraguariensis TaxID=185542 RepID=A0ABC8RQQ9_9AQUA
MSPPLLGAGEEANQSNITLLASPASLGRNIFHNISGLKEHNYMGLSDCSSVGSSTISTTSGDNNGCLNLKATELRLGLRGSQSSERDSEFSLLCSPNLEEKPLFPLHPLKDGNYLLSHKTVGPGNKRGFSDVMEGFAERTFLVSSEVNVILSPRPSLNSVLKSGSVKENTGTQPTKTKEVISKNTAQEKPRVADRVGTANNNSSAPATKAQVVGWPPARSFRKNTLASTSKNAEEVDGKARPGAMFIKVSMDGAPYLRKVDLRSYSAYQELSSALEKMFSCFTIVDLFYSFKWYSNRNKWTQVLSNGYHPCLLHGYCYCSFGMISGQYGSHGPPGQGYAE